MHDRFKNIESELIIQTSRSGGPGGQNVNKVETKVTVRFSIEKTELLTETDKVVINKKLKNLINQEGELILHSNKTRSQLKNKADVMQRLKLKLSKALEKKKKRLATKPKKSAIEKRIKEKKITSEKKKWRRGAE